MKNLSLSKIFVYLFLIVIGFISAFPFYFIVSAATNPSVEVVRGRMFLALIFLTISKILLI